MKISKQLTTVTLQFFIFFSGQVSGASPKTNTQKMYPIEVSRLLMNYSMIQEIENYETSQTKDSRRLLTLQGNHLNNIYALEDQKAKFKNDVRTQTLQFLQENFHGNIGDPLYDTLKNIDFENDKLGYDLFKKFVNFKSCNYNFKYFVGCSEAIRSIILSTKLEKQNLNSENESTTTIVATNTNAKILEEKVKFKIVDNFGNHFKVLENYEQNNGVMQVEDYKKIKENELKDYKTLFKNSEDNINLLFKSFEKEEYSKISKEVWRQGISQFLINAYDPHSELVSFEELKEFEIPKIKFGIGALLEKDKVGFRIAKVIKGGSASENMIQDGSYILSVDGVLTKNIKNVNDLVKLLTGEENTEVKVIIEFESKQREILLKRKKITKEAISTEILEFNNQNFLKIQFSDFMNNELCQKIYETVLSNQNVTGIILDIRGNGGGYVENALCVSSLFLQPKSVFSVTQYKSHNEIIKTKNLYQLYTGKVAILVDAASASASEMLAMAFKDNERALVVGIKTFGKGSGQNPYAIELAENLFIKLTLFSFHSPSGFGNQTIGVTPHIETEKALEIPKDGFMAFREADKFYFPIPPKNLNLNFKTINKKIEVDSICFNNADINETYKALSNDTPKKDLQVLSALAGLNCLK